MDKRLLIVTVVVLDVLGIGLFGLVLTGHFPGGLTAAPVGMIPILLAGVLFARDHQRAHPDQDAERRSVNSTFLRRLRRVLSVLTWLGVAVAVIGLLTWVLGGGSKHDLTLILPALLVTATTHLAERTLRATPQERSEAPRPPR